MVRIHAVRTLGDGILNFIHSTGYGQVCSFPVGFVRFTEPLEVLSSAVLNGGSSVASAFFIMEVPKDYDPDDPYVDAVRVRDELGLPEDTVGMMTAAEVDLVFNMKEASYEGMDVSAIATAGLSNHVVAGEVLDDYGEKSLHSAIRMNRMMAGTINVGVVSPVPLTMEGKVNMFMPLIEAKTAALADHGFVETGTTSDSMAVFSPMGESRVTYTGTGSYVGLAAAKAVRAAVNAALDGRDEHPVPVAPTRIFYRLGLTPDDLRRMVGHPVDEGFEADLRSIIEREDVAAAMDLAWFVCKRADSMESDGNKDCSDTILGLFSSILGVPKESTGDLMHDVICMIAKKAGGI